MLKRLCMLLTATTFLGGSLIAQEEEPASVWIPMRALLSPAQITHKLFQPGDPKIPHPFYKDMCKHLPPPREYQKAVGSATLLFNPNTNELKFAIAYSNLSGTPIMMHFHLGGVGVSGPIIQTIFGEPYNKMKGLGWSEKSPIFGKMGPKGNSGFIVGTYKLEGNPHLDPPLSTEDEKKLLMQGEIYINVHTCLNELGEIRGQIIPQSIPATE